MNKRVVVTGLGVISSIGIGWEEFWGGLLEGRSGISPVTSFDTANHFNHNGGEVKNFGPEAFIPADKIPLFSRASQLGRSAAKLAVKDSGLSDRALSLMRGCTCIGITSGSIQVIEHIDDKLVRDENPDSDLILQLPVHSTPSAVGTEFNLRGPNYIFSTACAAGNYAIGYGFDLIRMGRADMALAGGSDPFSRISFTGFNQFSAVAPEKCQPYDKNRKGMIPAEGAAVLVMERLDMALERDATIYAEVLGYGLSCDAYHMTTASVSGIAECMRKALKEAGLSHADVDYISAHGTGTIANDKNECAAIREVFGADYQKVPVSSIKSMLGHTMGAASALEAVACSLAVKNDMLPPTINFETPDPECDIDCIPNYARGKTVNIALNNSYAFGGNNASVVFKKFIQ